MIARVGGRLADRGRDAVVEAIAAAARRLPRGSRFAFEVDEVGIELGALRVSRPRRGHGSALLAAVVAIADGAGLPCRLVADPTLEPGDPDQDALLRLYRRFGFEVTSWDRRGGESPSMGRPARTGVDERGRGVDPEVAARG